MKSVFLLIAAAAVLPVSAPVIAQEVGGLGETSETGTAMRREAQDVDDRARINQYSKAVASCLYNRAEDRTHRLLLNSDPMTVDLEAAGIDRGRYMRQVEVCMGRRMHEFSSDTLLARVGMSFSMNRLRALLLEEAYLGANDAPPAISEVDTEALERSYVSTGPALVEAQGLARFADCVAYRDAAGADALLRTEPGSDEEMVSARALAPTLGDCMVAGQQIEFSPASIRAIAADGLWSRTVYGPNASGSDA